MVLLDIQQKYYTIAEYFTQEDASTIRHEFDNGTITEMAGGILPHNTIKLRLGGTLDRMLEHLKLPHMALNSDTKVRIEAANKFVYPDVTISDGTPEYYNTPEGALRRDTIINPLVIFEVLSEDTRSYDKGEKFDELYSTVPGFREYVLIEPERVWVKSLYLQDFEQNIWIQQTLTDRKASLHLYTLGLEIALDDLYAALDRLPK